MHDLSSVTQIYIYVFQEQGQYKTRFICQRTFYLSKSGHTWTGSNLYLIEIFRLSDKYQENWEKKLDTK